MAKLASLSKYTMVDRAFSDPENKSKLSTKKVVPTRNTIITLATCSSILFLQLFYCDPIIMIPFESETSDRYELYLQTPTYTTYCVSSWFIKV